MVQAKHALVVGASSGIGRAVAHEVAPLVTKLTLASRPCPPDLISSIKERNSSIEVTHVKLDVSSLHEVRKFTDNHKDAAFDWIILSPGILSIKGRTETPEGLDVKMATHFYGRDLMAQAFSEKASSASFMHAMPGAVATSIANGLPCYLRIPAKAVTPLVARPAEQCAKYMVSALTKEEFNPVAT
ncbi:unnamed protein product [Phytophthora lilii]|uniref:Unnamed protein product n=1 Tax=Phytophthora lilii TaxID=2077276 RepID=A0A9W6WGW9_9STRA|nr:unnamed protein product [Phytophthora lilii]